MATLSEVVFAITFGKPDESNLTKAQQDSRKAAREVAQQWRDAGKEIGKAFAAVSVAALGAGAGIFKLVDGVSKAGDEVAKTSRGLGVAAREMQRLRFAAERSGSSAEGMTKALRALTVGLQDAATKGTGPVAEGLEALGLGIDALRGKGVEDQFAILADALNKVEDGATRSAISMKLFGVRGGAELVPLMREGAAGIRALGDEAESLGAVLDDKTLAASEKFADDLLNLKSAVKGVVASVAGGLMPEIGRYLQLAKDWALANRELIQQKLQDAVGKIVDALRTFVPLALQLVGIMGDLTSALGPAGAAGAMATLKLAMSGSVGPIGLVAAALGTVTLALIGIAENAQLAKFAIQDLGAGGRTGKRGAGFVSAEETDLMAARQLETRGLEAAQANDTIWAGTPGLQAKARAAAAGHAQRIRQIDQSLKKIRMRKAEQTAYEDAQAASLSPGDFAPAMPPEAKAKKRGGGRKRNEDGILIDTGDDGAEAFRPELEALARANGLSASAVDSALTAGADSLKGFATKDVARRAALSRLGGLAGKDFTPKASSDPLLSDLLGSDVPDIELSAIARGAQPQTLISTINNTFTFTNDFAINGAGDPGEVGRSVADQIVDAFQGALAASTKTAKVVFAR